MKLAKWMMVPVMAVALVACGKTEAKKDDKGGTNKAPAAAEAKAGGEQKPAGQ